MTRAGLTELMNQSEANAGVSESIVQDVAQQMGIASLKLKQMEAILVFLSGKDIFVTLPTGYSNYIIFACFQHCSTE